MYAVLNRTFGLLSTKDAALLADVGWNIAFYSHITCGGLALLVGWVQFQDKLRLSRPAVHRGVGAFYIAAVIISAVSGIVIGFSATGGWVTEIGFILLGIVWLTTTILAYRAIRQHHIDLHRQWMVYSYAASFAAVTLRIWLPLLIMLTQDFFIAYKLVAWLCWVPNILVAYWINRTYRIITSRLDKRYAGSSDGS